MLEFKICLSTHSLTITHLRNIKRAPCLHSLMQTREGVWENEKVCVNPSRHGEGLHKLSRSPKLTRVFASGYVNTASVLYFFYKINGLQKYIRSGQLYLNFKIKIIITIATAKHVASQTRQISQSCITKKKKNRTFTKVQQGSQHFNSCVLKIYLRVMFTHQIHQIHQKYSNYTDSGQILKESVLFEPHGLKFHRNFPLVLKRTKLTKARS